MISTANKRTYDETFDYCHKKFGKRQRLNSENDRSSSATEETSYSDLLNNSDSSGYCSTNTSLHDQTIHHETLNKILISVDNDYDSNSTKDGKISSMDKPMDLSKIPEQSKPVDYSLDSTNVKKRKDQLQKEDNVLSNENPPKKIRRSGRLNAADAKQLFSVPKEKIFEICKYHPNMARIAPPKERTPKDYEKRVKNTLACRKTRRVQKLSQLASEERYKESKLKYFNIVKEQNRASIYIRELAKLNTMRIVIFSQLTEEQNEEIIRARKNHLD